MKEILSTLKWGKLISMIVIFWSQASCRQKHWGTCSKSNMYCFLGTLLVRQPVLNKTKQQTKAAGFTYLWNTSLYIDSQPSKIHLLNTLEKWGLPCKNKVYQPCCLLTSHAFSMLSVHGILLIYHYHCTCTGILWYGMNFIFSTQCLKPFSKVYQI